MADTVIASYEMKSEDGKGRIVVDLLSAGYATRLTIYREGQEPSVIYLGLYEMERLHYAVDTCYEIMQTYNS